MEEWPPIWRVAANILNKQSRTVDKEWSCTGFVANHEHLPRTWIDTLMRAKMDHQEVGCGGV